MCRTSATAQTITTRVVRTAITNQQRIQTFTARCYTPRGHRAGQAPPLEARNSAM